MSFLPVDVVVDQKAKQRHRIDTLNLLAYVILLVAVLISTWFLKRRKRLYLHETGLAIIYGLLMGAALRYFGLEVTISSTTLESQTPRVIPADYVLVEERILSDNKSHLYAYEFRGELQPSAKLGSQISYASVDPEVFFNIILPPIVLNAGLSLKRRHFFRNIGAIFSFAFLGTTISVAFVGLFLYGAIQVAHIWLGASYLAERFSLTSCLYFGAIISPTDPLAVLAIFQELGVDVNLFALVFGESILNDAVSIVLTQSIDQISIIYGRNPYYPAYRIALQCAWNFLTMLLESCVIGVTFGIVSALFTKFTKLTESPLLESSLVVLTSYASFLVAEVLDSSGIVAILLCGISQAHYTLNNLSFEARERLRSLFELLTFLCETFLFLAVGVSFWQRDQTWDLGFAGLAFVAVTLARAASIYPLAALLNLGRRNRIPGNFQHLIAWGGAARGVISYSLAARNTVGDARRIMLSTTSLIVIVSVILVGGSVDQLLRCLKIPFGESGAGADGDDQRAHHHQPAVASLSNNPNWLIRPKRLRRNNSSGSLCPLTPRCALHSARHHPPATPIMEVARADELAGCSEASSLEPTAGHTSRRHCATCNLDEQHQTTGNPITTPSPSKSAETSQTNPNEQHHQHQHLQYHLQNQQQMIVHHNQSQPILAETSDNNNYAYENANIVRRWRNLDNNFIKPLLTNSHPTLMETLPPALNSLARLFTSDEQLMRISTRN